MKGMKLLSALLFLTICVLPLSADNPKVDLRAMKKAIVNAQLVLQEKRSTPDAVAKAIASIGDHDHKIAAAYLLTRITKIGTGLTYVSMISDRKYGPQQWELLQLEKACARFTCDEAAVLFRKTLPKLRDMARLSLLQGLKGTGDRELDEVYFKLLMARKTDYRELTIAVEAMGLRRFKKALPALQEIAGDTKRLFGIRCTALRALSRMPDASSIEPLITCTGQEGRIACEAHNALWSITDKQFSLKGQWQTWWKNNREGFVPPEEPELHFNHEIRGKVNWQRFYGIPIAANRIMFILDRSGSMSRGDKMGGVKKELSRICHLFGKRKQFNILFFNTSVKLWQQQKPYIKPASNANLKKLAGFLKSTHPIGGTQTEEAVKEVLTRLLPAADLETLILLSDGLPNSDPQFVATTVYHMNRYLKARIHTIFVYQFGREQVAADKDSPYAHNSSLTAAEFMQMIADMNDGIFRKISSLEATAGSEKP